MLRIIATALYAELETTELLLALKKTTKLGSGGWILCDAEDLELDLAIMGGKWLTQNEVQKLTNTPIGLQYKGQPLARLPQYAQLPLEYAGMKASAVIQPNREECAMCNGFIHVIVVVLWRAIPFGRHRFIESIPIYHDLRRKLQVKTTYMKRFQPLRERTNQHLRTGTAYFILK